jgi:hypothetical protein
MNTEKPINIIELMFFGGLKYFKEKEKINLELFNDKLTINKNLILPLERIKDIYIEEDVKTKQKDKSVIGRSILGLVIAGPIGAGIGAASGIGKKEVKDVTKYVVINYIDKNDNNNILKFIIYNNWGYDKVVEEFVKEIRQMIGLSEIINELEKIPDCPQEI